MYVRTENGETIEIFVNDCHIHEIREDDREYYAQCYSRPNVKPVEGTSLWQLFYARLNGDGEVCVATFDTVSKANEALRSLRSTDVDGGWDAIEYKNQMRKGYGGGGGGPSGLNVLMEEIKD